MNDKQLKLFNLYGVDSLVGLRDLSHLQAYYAKIDILRDRIARLYKVYWLWRPDNDIAKCYAAIEWNYDRVKELV